MIVHRAPDGTVTGWHSPISDTLGCSLCANGLDPEPLDTEAPRRISGERWFAAGFLLGFMLAVIMIGVMEHWQ